MRVLAIDPSVNHIGWAIMEPGHIIRGGTINAPPMRKAEEVERISWIIDLLDTTVLSTPFDNIVIERPETWGSYKSQASRGSGDLQLLTLVVGALMYWAYTTVGAVDVHLIKVTEWKGQLPKSVTRERMEKKYGCRLGTDHESDAVGIADYYLAKEQTDGTKRA